MVWDTAGQEEFDAITRTYYRGAGAAVLVFSTTDQASFHAVTRWKDKIQAESGPIPMALVQNKVDLMDQAEVSSEDAEALTRQLRLRFYRTCVKDNLNVSEGKKTEMCCKLQQLCCKRTRVSATQTVKQNCSF
ncbi:Ras- protein Rab-23 [Trebouxia sp. C0010 RCD-2024]